MTVIREAIGDYLAVRRVLGYKLEDHGWLLADFASFLETAGAGALTISLAWSGPRCLLTACRRGTPPGCGLSAASPGTCERSTRPPRFPRPAGGRSAPAPIPARSRSLRNACPTHA